jgi:hypothetical protein
MVSESSDYLFYGVVCKEIVDFIGGDCLSEYANFEDK